MFLTYRYAYHRLLRKDFEKVGRRPHKFQTPRDPARINDAFIFIYAISHFPRDTYVRNRDIWSRGHRVCTRCLAEY